MFLGYVCEQHDNPADFFLDVICANERSAIDEGANNIYYATLHEHNIFSYVVLSGLTVGHRILGTF